MIVLYVCGFVHLSTVPVEDRSTVGCESPSMGTGTHTPSPWKSSKHPEALGQPLFGIFVDFFNVEKFFALTQQTVVKSIVYVRLPKNETKWTQERDLLGSAPQTSHPNSAEGPSWPDKLRLLWGRRNCWLNSKMTVLCWQSQGMCLFQMRRARETQNTGLGLREHMHCGRTG